MRQIIILETSRGTGLGDTNLRHVFWFPITQARRVPKPSATSAFRDALPAEITALQDGSVIEEVFEIQIPSGRTPAQIKNVLETRYQLRLAELAALPNPNSFYGTSFDGTIWS